MYQKDAFYALLFVLSGRFGDSHGRAGDSTSSLTPQFSFDWEDISNTRDCFIGCPDTSNFVKTTLLRVGVLKTKAPQDPKDP